MDIVKKKLVFYVLLFIFFILIKLVYKIDCLIILFFFNDIYDYFYILILNEMKIRLVLLVCLFF